MNIALRQSGGRGEYELAGRQGAIGLEDLYERPIYIEIIPGVSINAHSQCVLKQGKPRIRLTQAAKNAHPTFLIAAAMMLPKPRRERSETGGGDLLQREQFVVQTVRIDVAVPAEEVIVSPIVVRLENGTGQKLDINFAQRMASVMRVWKEAQTKDDPVAKAVRAHAQAFSAEGSSQQAMLRAYSELNSSLSHPIDDLLPILETRFGLAAPSSRPEIVLSGEQQMNDFDEEVLIRPAEARVERVRQWRLAAIRGGSASDFRLKVREAYDHRCLFSGQRLPRTEMTSTSGVDAAHILPWCNYDLDATPNGLCLNKQFHWAFDEGLLRLNFDDRESAYVVRLGAGHFAAAEAAGFDLRSFEAVAGRVPLNHLPKDQRLWPSRAYLNELNRFLDGAAR